MRPPDRNPDYLPQAAALWVNDLHTSLETLVKRGALKREEMPGGAELYTLNRR